MIASYNVGGVVWDYGQYALGLEALGFDVYYLEDTGWESFDPRTGTYGPDCSYGAAFLRTELTRLSPSLADRWHLRSMDGTTYGMPAAALADVVEGADVFLNVSGAALLRPEYERSERKVLIDTDPGWNHFRNYPKWDAAGAGWYGTAGWRAHDHFFTYAERMGRPGCLLPHLGVEWRPTRPVVTAESWQPESPGDVWTTVMTWKNFAEAIEHEGTVYGTKEIEFQRVQELPRLVDVALEVAVGGSGAPIDEWRALGWRVVDSLGISPDSERYRSYVQQSRGEFSVAKNVYVDTASGWFSCRSVCYLAAGRPVVVQDTGFSEVVPTGEGLLCFSSVEEAAKAITTVEETYLDHSEAARKLAIDEFGVDRVLGQLLGEIGLS